MVLVYLSLSETDTVIRDNLAIVEVPEVDLGICGFW